MSIIVWCNDNSGFLTAVLSAIGLFISFLAVIISIRTARLPYKKKLCLSSFICLGVGTSYKGIGASAANIGNRTINLVYLGFAIKTANEWQKMQSVSRLSDHEGILQTTEIMSIHFSSEEFLKGTTQLGDKLPLFVYAQDSEGKIYKKRYGTVGKARQNLT